MSKDPAFLFYSQDFLVGTMTMPFEDKGKYITILCYMHQNGPISDETIRLLVGNTSASLMSKFTKYEDGLWHNERLEIEVKKRSKFTESRKSNGLKGGRPAKNQIVTKEKTIRLSIAKPKNNLPEDVIDNVNDIEIKIEDLKNSCEEKIEKEQIDFTNEILSFWGFSEQNHFQNYKSFRQVYRLFELNDAKLQHFKQQCRGYVKYKKMKSANYRHSFENFLGKAENGFEDGAWNKENWEEKLRLDAEDKTKSPDEAKLPNVWDKELYLKLTPDKQRVYVAHLKKELKGQLDFNVVTGQPVWKHESSVNDLSTSIANKFSAAS